MTLSFWLILIGAAAGADAPAARPLADFPLRDPAFVERWQGRHDLERVEAIESGMRLTIGGADPYLTSPPHDFPADSPLQAKLTLRSDEAGFAQLFYFSDGPTEARSVRFPVRGGGLPFEAVVPLPPLGKQFRFRFDPPGARGVCVVERFVVTARAPIAWPAWSAPTLPERRATDLRLRSGELELRHSADAWGAFELSWRGASVAGGHNRPLVGHLIDGRPSWIDVSRAARVAARIDDGRLAVEATFRDDQGVEWRLQQHFAPGADHRINVTTELHVSKPRDVFFLPTLLVLPGLGSYGPRKNQGLAAGYEYLSDEPSSSQADLEGPAADRRVVTAEKVTFPLLAIQHADHYLALTWHVERSAAPLFDSPDRTVGGGAHVMGIVAPGSSEGEREDGSPVAHRPIEVRPDRPLRHSATLFAGDGRSVVPAVQAYLAGRGGPPEPPALPPLDQYVAATTAAWCDTEIRDGVRFRHALGGTFPAHPAFDAAWMLLWLADLTRDEGRAAELRTLAGEAAAAVPAGHEYHSHVGHLKSPAGGAVFGRVEPALQQARDVARQLAGRFDADGVARYRPPAQGVDYSRTNGSLEASGLAAQPVAQRLEAAAFSGDSAQIAQALQRLADLRRYDHGVPRGAQTWEIPLHTPDILASAHLTRACVWGYELTGDRQWLERAVYWAWTGVPFIYLDSPCDGPVGRYATIAVYGATNWQAPNWIGLPVQWCGLVYADALRTLARHDPRGPWDSLARGVVASAVQQIYPPDHPRRGLLPDSFSLVVQSRNPADINPGTLQPLALWAYTGAPAWDYLALRDERLSVHAPGRLERVARTDARAAWTYTPWRRGPSTLVLHGAPPDARLTLDGRPLPVDGRRVRRAGDSATLLIECEGRGEPLQFICEPAPAP